MLAGRMKRMRITLGMWMGIVAVVGGCVAAVWYATRPNTFFFISHDATSHFRAVAAERGLTVWSSSSGGSPRERDFQLHIDGNAEVRSSLIEEYRRYVSGELDDCGVNVFSSGSSSDGIGLDGFNFSYRRAGMTGIFRTTTAIETNGCVQIDVFMYEHR